MAKKKTAKKQIALLSSAKTKRSQAKIRRIRANIKALGLKESDITAAIRWATDR